MQTFGRRGQQASQQGSGWSRPTTPAPQSSSGGLDLRGWTLVIWGLFLASFLVAPTSIVALILAYIKRKAAAGTDYESHMTYAIRTFWIAFLGAIVGVILTFAAVGWSGWL
jgi:uncharacterized membrane protein